MTAEQIFEQIKLKKSFLCVGLDTDLNKIPKHIIDECKQKSEDPEDEGDITAEAIYEFNRQIIDATAPYTVCYKPNLAFYEAHVSAGLQAMYYTCSYIKQKYPEIFLIADAKRGDIGNTSKMYADAFIGDDKLFDAVTISPYMGRDSVDPFTGRAGKWAIILALTSNPSAADFELQKLESGEYLYEKVITTSKEWGTTDNIMYVVGATQAKTLKGIRELIPDHFLLVPGVGAQGGSLSEVAEYGMNSRCGLLVNSSRAIIYADNTENFAAVAGQKAKEVAAEMAVLLDRYL